MTGKCSPVCFCMYLLTFVTVWFNHKTSFGRLSTTIGPIDKEDRLSWSNRLPFKSLQQVKVHIYRHIAYNYITMLQKTL